MQQVTYVESATNKGHERQHVVVPDVRCPVEHLSTETRHTVQPRLAGMCETT